MPDTMTTAVIDLLGSEELASTAGITIDRWRRRHVLDWQGPEAIGPSNAGRLPYISVRLMGEDYRHETAAPRGGTRATTIRLYIAVNGMGSRLNFARQRLAALADAASAVIRSDPAFTIGDEQRGEPERRPYGWLQELQMTVETSYDSDYDC